MKSIKNILSLIIALTALGNCQSIQSAEFFNDVAVEIYNKTKSDIGVAIINMNNNVSHTMVVPAEQAKKYDANIDARLRIEVWSPSNPSAARTVISINAPGKTKYLSYDSAKSPALYPQTGPLLGLMGKTKSGLPLKNNIKSSDIVVEKSQTSMSQVPTRTPQAPVQSKPATTAAVTPAPKPSSGPEYRVPSETGPFSLILTNKSNQPIGLYITHSGAPVAYTTVNVNSKSLNLGKNLCAIGEAYVSIISPFTTQWPEKDTDLYTLGAKGKKFKIKLNNTSPDLIWDPSKSTPLYPNPQPFDSTKPNIDSSAITSVSSFA